MISLQFSLSLLFILVSTFYLPNAFAQDSTQWSLPEGAIARLGKGRIMGPIAYSPDSRQLAVPSTIGVWIYDAEMGEALDLLTGHESWVRSVAFSPDGQRLASSCWDETIELWVIELWDVKTGRHIRTLAAETSSILCVAFSPDGTEIAGAGSEQTITFWDVETGRHLRTIERIRVGSIALLSHPMARHSQAEGDGTIHLWNAKTRTHIRTFKGHTDDVNSIAFSPDGATLASGSDDKTIRLWNAKTGEHLHTFGRTHWGAGWGMGMAFSPDSQTIASGDLHNIIRVWDVDTREILRTLTGHKAMVDSVTFSPDGQTLASGSTDGTVLLWKHASVKK